HRLGEPLHDRTNSFCCHIKYLPSWRLPNYGTDNYLKTMEVMIKDKDRLWNKEEHIRQSQFIVRWRRNSGFKPTHGIISKIANGTSPKWGKILLSRRVMSNHKFLYFAQWVLHV